MPCVGGDRSVQVLRQGVGETPHFSEFLWRVSHQSQLVENGRRLDHQLAEEGVIAGRCRMPKLNPTSMQKLEEAMVRGAQAQGFLNDLWTLPRVAELIHRQSGVRLHSGHVWRLLGRRGWSLQRPAGKAVQRDEGRLPVSRNTLGPR